MKSKIILYLSVIALALQISCKSTKNITMFQDMQKENFANVMLNQPPIHVIKPFDNLYVNILTLDQNVNGLFNPSMSGSAANSNTAYTYGTPAGQHINGYRITQEGIITLPILGEINLMNLTLEEAQKKIKTKAEEYLKEPTVHVKLLNYKVEILGEVVSPNQYYNYEGTFNILEAIAVANGITLYADLKNVIVTRKEGDKINSYKVNLTNDSFYDSEVYYLQPNDIIYIPPTRLKKRSSNNSTFSIILSTITTIIAIFAVTK